MTFNQIKYFVTVAECLSFTGSSKMSVYHAAGIEPPDQCHGTGTWNETFCAG